MAVKDAFPDALVLADVALDPYSTSGQDGVVDEETGAVLNDMTVYQICKQVCGPPLWARPCRWDSSRHWLSALSGQLPFFPGIV